MEPRSKRAPARQRKTSRWKLDEARMNFAELVERAQKVGPQYVSLPGKKSVAVIDAEELQRLLSPASAQLPFVEFLESLYAPGLDLERVRDPGRDAPL